jgi:hypothetical protein
LNLGGAYTLSDIQKTYDTFLDTTLAKTVLVKILKHITGEDTKKINMV